ncbi:MAG: sigma-70 family RNA polymerase sigma factor [Chloroflexota bacterium]|nr:sigma-70 family RNA polymerase sigma factor [Chloroflexota bacterium]
MAEPDGEVVRRAQAGDGQALVALVESQQTYVYSIARSLMADPADAADMTQEAFVRLLRALPSFRAETKFTTWLYRLATNVCLDELRRRGHVATSLDEDDGEQSPGALLADGDPWGQPEPALAMNESAREVHQALAALPRPQRLALTLHYFEDLRYEDIAGVMRLPVNTVKSHLRRGKERLAGLLRDSWQGKEAAPCSAAK